MSGAPVVHVFNETRKRAEVMPTWRLKVWTCWAQRRSERRHTDADILRFIALRYELRHRPPA